MSKNQIDFEFFAIIETLRKEKKNFCADWPYVFDLNHKNSAIRDWIETAPAEQADHSDSIEQLWEWVFKNCGGPSHDTWGHLPNSGLLGIRDVDAAFWFKVCWM